MMTRHSDVGAALAADEAETIAAVATAPGEGAIAIVRISGAAALAIADRLFSGSAMRPSHCRDGSFLRGNIRSAQEKGGSIPTEILDEAVLLVFRAPRSYTREDVVEIQCHGGNAAARRILGAVLQSGARAAEAGEFTKRAFLNGRIDLLQAEAVAEMIRAKSDRAAAVAVEQLRGRSSSGFKDIYDGLLSVAADVEAALDFDDEAGISVDIGAVRERIECEYGRIALLLAATREGRILRDGAMAVILGRPNAGKSTLLNTLLGHDRAIVADAPGTTRDTIEETLILGGYPVRLVDTAGLRATDCDVERQGVDRARAIMRMADIVLYVLDATCPHADDRALLNELSPERTLVLANKIDCGWHLKAEDTTPFQVLPISLLRAEGLEAVRTAMLEKLRPHSGPDLNVLVSERHGAVLRSILGELDEAQSRLISDREEGLPMVARHIREAMGALGEITGQSYSDDLLQRVFSRFCLGK